MACANAVDPFETHAMIYAAIQMKMEKVAKNLLKHTHPMIRRAAAMSLDQMDDDILTVEDVVFRC